MTITGTGTTPTDVVSDIISNSGTLSAHTAIEGLHIKSGVRMFVGLLYQNKSYGSFLIINYTGVMYSVKVDNGSISYQTITMS